MHLPVLHHYCWGVRLGAILELGGPVQGRCAVTTHALQLYWGLEDVLGCMQVLGHRRGGGGVFDAW